MPKIVAGLDLRSVTQPLWLLRYVGIRLKEGIFFFFFFRILSILTRTGKDEKILKKLIIMYIQNDLTLRYTAQALTGNS